MNWLESIKILKRRISEGNNYPLRKGKNGNFIFIHINKTAGTSIAKCIGLPKKRHLTVKQVIKIVGKNNFMNAYKFAVVRNPWSKVVSHYQYRVRTNQNELGTKPIPFDLWVMKTYGSEKDLMYYDYPKMFMPQVEWLRDDKGIISVNKIFKFEELPEAFDEIAKEIGINSNLPKLNATDKVDYRAMYDETSKLIIAQHFKEDIDLLNYRF